MAAFINSTADRS